LGKGALEMLLLLLLLFIIIIIIIIIIINARNVSFQSLYGGKTTLSAQLINPKFCVSRPHRRSTTVSLEPNPLALVKSFLGL